MNCIVVNIRSDDFDVYGGRQVTIRRPAGSIVLRRSPWANPFRLGVDGSREQVIAMFRAHFLTRTDLMRRARAELAGKRIACWCAPDPCHLDVVAAVVNLTDLQFRVLVDVVEATRDRVDHLVHTARLYEEDQVDELHALLHLGQLDLIEVFDGDLVEDLAVRVPRPPEGGIARLYRLSK